MDPVTVLLIFVAGVAGVVASRVLTNSGKPKKEAQEEENPLDEARRIREGSIEIEKSLAIKKAEVETKEKDIEQKVRTLKEVKEKIEKKQEEIEELHKKAQEELEHVSG